MLTSAFDLYLITDPAFRDDLLERVARALADGCGARMAVQLRDKQLATRELVALGRALHKLTRAAGGTLIVNSRADVALAIGAEGVQLPETGPSVLDARRDLGPHHLVGVSRHDAPGIAAAAAQGADFATLSPIHPVAGKGPALGLAGFAAIARTAPLPVYALGGVQACDVPPLLAAGARGVALIRAVLAAPDAGQAANDVLASFPPRTR